MTATQVVINALLASGGVTTLVGQKITPPPKPQGTEGPSIVVYLAAENEGYTLRGASSYPRSRVSVECHAVRYSDADNLGETVIAALKDYPSSTFAIMKEGVDVADYENSFQTARRIIDFVVWRRT